MAISASGWAGRPRACSASTHAAASWAGRVTSMRGGMRACRLELGGRLGADRKSTRLNSSHLGISYAVFCLKKKKKEQVTKSARVREWQHSGIEQRDTNTHAM